MAKVIALTEMLDISGFKDINTYDNPSEPRKFVTLFLTKNITLIQLRLNQWLLLEPIRGWGLV